MALRNINWITFFMVVAITGLMMITGCNKKSETTTGGGASNQSVVTLKGAAS